MKENMRLSIIIPVYNAEKYIKNCLDSLLRQNVGGIEILCIDDGSTDFTKYHHGPLLQDSFEKHSLPEV